MGSISGDELSLCSSPRSVANDERIFVSVRLRPLNDKELARNDVSDWECISSNTIVFKNSIAERSLYPTAYTFDRVFGSDSSTEQVYEEAAKDVALSVVSGINSTIFAYGQTSSGKTYTMSGVTERTVADIFDYIEKHNDREYLIKFSAIEIYNESVRDLLSQDSTPLRLLDDPERGTVVEKLTEEAVKDYNHLKDLLSVCEAQRQIGETSLNEVSSRSHQILRLTIESSSVEFKGAQRSSVLAASVNFVDLAGSERASQAMSAGTRLKEGCHINRSLLTLGTVIRKLSKGRNGHVPYRDSKLTRILQNSLGGNARTAIICTMSPARTHVEQSRNTLLFATCAKEVNTNAQVNLVVSDKALVKQLQRELAKLESELKKSSSMPVMPNSAAMLKEKELIIQKMDHEIKVLKKERDRALSRVQDLLGSGGEYHEYQVSRPLAEGNLLLKPYVQHAWAGESSASDSDVIDRRSSDVTTSGASHMSDRYDVNDSSKDDFHFLENVDEHFLSDDTSPREEIEKLFGPDPSRGWEMSVQKQLEDSQDHCKEVQCVEETKTNTELSNVKSNTTVSEGKTAEDLSKIDMSPRYEALTQKIRKLKKTISYLVTTQPLEHSPHLSERNMFSPKLTRSRSCRAFFTPATSSQLEKTEKNENTPPNVFEIDFLGRLQNSYSVKGSKLKFEENVGNLSGKYSPVSAKASLVDGKGLKSNLSEDSNLKFENDVVNLKRNDSLVSVKTTPGNEKELVVKHQVEEVCDEQEAKPKMEVTVDVVDLNPKGKPDELAQNSSLEKSFDMNSSEDDLVYEVRKSTCKSPEMNTVHGSLLLPSDWQAEFERQRREIIEYWDVCNVPLSHRTRFFLLFKADQSDSVYMEVELRRLTFLKSKLFQGTLVIDGQMLTLALSKKALDRERKLLGRQMRKKFSNEAREELYKKWDINVNSKQRRQQLCSRIWTETKDMEHINESAAIVAKLIGFSESDQHAKEMFGFNVMARPISRTKSLSWA